MTDPRAEIWESFVSLLRCYAAAASVPGSEYRVINEDGVTLVEFEQRVLAFHFEPGSGEATWQLSERGTESRGAFHMHEDSTLEFADEAKELDIAAIDFIEQLSDGNSEPQSPSAAVSSTQNNLLSFRPRNAELPDRRHHPVTRAPLPRAGALPFVKPGNLYRKFAAASKHSQSSNRAPKP